MSQSAASAVPFAPSNGSTTLPGPHQLAAQTVLIVEDSKVEQLRLKAMLQKFGYEVHCADNGSQALELLARKPIRLVISDWRMPQISGIDLCRQLREDPDYHQPYFILVTGQNTKTDLVAGMDAGADDFITKPFNSEELRVRLQAGARIVRLRSEVEQRNSALNKTLQREAEAYALIRKDLDAAAHLQQELLPDNSSPFSQLEISSLFLPAAMVAGDSFNYFKLDDDYLAFYHIDVAGHGIASAMLSFTVSHFLSPELGGIKLRQDESAQACMHPELPGHIVPPELVVDSLNRRFLEKGDCQQYFTMVYGVLNVHTGVGHLCQAGHPHPFSVRQRGDVIKLGEGGFPVGMLEQAAYESVRFTLGIGDRLYLYSDGITESTNAEGDEFGAERLGKLLKCSKGCRIETGVELLNELLGRWHGDAPLEDDISMLAIGRIN